VADLFSLDMLRAAKRTVALRSTLHVDLSTYDYAKATWGLLGVGDGYVVSAKTSGGYDLKLADADPDVLERYIAFRALVHRLNNGRAVDLDAELARIAYRPTVEEVAG
jgi:hypothetical protein